MTLTVVFISLNLCFDSVLTYFITIKTESLYKEKFKNERGGIF